MASQHLGKTRFSCVPTLDRPKCRAPPAALSPCAEHCAGASGVGVTGGWVAPAGAAHYACASRTARPLQDPEPPGVFARHWLQAPPSLRWRRPSICQHRRLPRGGSGSGSCRSGPRERAARQPPPPRCRGSVSAVGTHRLPASSCGAASPPRPPPAQPTCPGPLPIRTVPA